MKDCRWQSFFAKAFSCLVASDIVKVVVMFMYSNFEERIEIDEQKNFDIHWMLVIGCYSR
jgi:hypothetical protein